jgi:EAL domain-containing protein (putative c-di-GMP-specific phosphodiesterase class I)
MSKKSCEACVTGNALPFDFTMAFQPIVDVTTQKAWGYEALVRGLKGEGAASILAQVNDENRYQFDQACRVKAIETAQSLFDDPSLRLSINFMPNAVYEPAACIKTTLETAHRVGFSRDRIMFEFTEDEQMTDVAHVKHIVSEYRKFGFMTAIDDFGSGYAGLNLLASLQPDLIKIDIELIRDIQNSRAKQAIIAGITSIAREMDMIVLAEGIESADELHILRAAGIKLFQGFYFAKPQIGRLPFVSFEIPLQSSARAVA